MNSEFRINDLIYFFVVNGNGNDLWMVRLHGKSFFYKFPCTKTEIEKGVSINCVAVFSEF